MRLTIASKFLAVLAVVGPLLVLVALGGVSGVRAMKDGADDIFEDSIKVSDVVTEVGNNLARAQAIANQLALAPGMQRREHLNAQLDVRVIPRVERGLAELTRLHDPDSAAERIPVRDLELGWRRFLALRHRTLLPQAGRRPTVAAATRVSERVAAVLDPMIASVARLDRGDRACPRGRQAC